MHRPGPRPLFTASGILDRSVARRLRRATRLALFLDYDGTLTHIAPTPADAVLSPQARAVLRALAVRRGTRMAIVTGRSLGQIRPMIRPLPVDLAVNHGLQIVSGRRTWIHPVLRESVPDLKMMMRALTGALGPIPGVRIEDKRWSLCVHFRNVALRRIPAVRNAVREIVHPYRAQLTVLHGKMVMEIRPAIRWTKGHAVLRLLSGPRYGGALPVFIGDDRTDEDAFLALAQRGLTIRVGRSLRSAAHYRLTGVPEVIRLLEWLCTVR